MGIFIFIFLFFGCDGNNRRTHGQYRIGN